jgi:hypothetical protein
MLARFGKEGFMWSPDLHSLDLHSWEGNKIRRSALCGTTQPQNVVGTSAPSRTRPIKSPANVEIIARGLLLSNEDDTQTYEQWWKSVAGSKVHRTTAFAPTTNRWSKWCAKNTPRSRSASSRIQGQIHSPRWSSGAHYLECRGLNIWDQNVKGCRPTCTSWQSIGGRFGLSNFKVCMVRGGKGCVYHYPLYVYSNW